MKKTLRQAGAAFAACAILLCGCPFFAGAETVPAEPKQVQQAGTLPSYASYLAGLNQKKPAGKELFLAAEEAETAGEKGEQGVALSPSQTLVWRCTVQEAGRYELTLSYTVLQDDPAPAFSLLVDGAVPYGELEEYPLSAVYQDEEKRFNEAGDQLISRQNLLPLPQTRGLFDPTGMTDGRLSVYLEPGAHTLTLTALHNTFCCKGLLLGPPEQIPSDREARAALASLPMAKSEPILLEAEEPARKSHRTLYARYDRSNPATTPYAGVRIRRNTIGSGSRTPQDMWLSYDVETKQAGLYYISFKTRQNETTDHPVRRILRVNGKIPARCFAHLSFPAEVNWNWMTAADSEGAAMPIWLEAGKNTLELSVGSAESAHVLSEVSRVLQRLGDLYVRIVMITGTRPDRNRDYRLEQEIEGLRETFAQEAERLEQAAEQLDKLSGEHASSSEEMRSMARRLRDFSEKPAEIPLRLLDYRNGISSLNAWITGAKEQPLELDSILLHTDEQALPPASAGFFARLAHEFRIFFASFTESYDGNGPLQEGEKPLRVWVNMGRDQIQVIRDLTVDHFTPETGVPVYFSVVQTGLIESVLSGRNPDLALGVARGQPVNLAVRDALLGFSPYAGFEEMKTRFAPSAMVPYTLNGEVYAVPCSQRFFVLFYRADILASLGLRPPKTWEELRRIMPKLQRQHMTVGLPYAVISAAAAVDNGMGAKDLYATLLLQNKGAFYTQDSTATRLHEEQAVTAFDDWCRFYKRYGFDLIYDFYTRFVSGEMPMGIASFDMIQTLNMAAEEIRGRWNIALIPGTEQPDGTIDRSEAGSGTAAVIFKTADRPELAYQFVDFWTKGETQTDFCRSTEQLLGVGGRYETANLEAFATQPWGKDRLEILQQQRAFVQEIPEIPGSYYVSRSIDNAFRSVIYDGDNPREALERENRNINREIRRKRQELGLFVPEA